MSGRAGGPDGPEDVDAAFAEIVADLEREGLGANVIDAGLADPDLPGTGHLEPAAEPPSPPQPSGWRTSSTEWDSGADEEHYVPPDPPPLPKLRPGTIIGLLLLIIGVLLLAIPGSIGLSPRIGTPLALICLATGIGWLVLRIRQGPPPGTGRDDGAQL